MSEYVSVTATATRDGVVLATVWLGTVERWAWDDPGHRALWKRSRRPLVLDEACTSERVRVSFAAEYQDDEG